MRRPALLVLVLALVLAACGGEGESSPPTTTISGEEPTTEEAAPTETEPEPTTESEASGPVVLLETAGGEEVTVRVEIADDDQERQVGLMNRESLPADAGMIFLFDGDVSGGFWMKNTLIPLSIAFADADGTILSILDMEPCEADPCEVYDPGVSYRSALEVNQGAFADWGVAEGDRLTLRQ
ncbi:MAG TPA: DUF192 domain-containing protein [Gaiellaceae bacterium]|nr:DUF192 domain-containing protein [Gaiellaceae bacterium]